MLYNVYSLKRKDMKGGYEQDSRPLPALPVLLN